MAENQRTFELDQIGVIVRVTLLNKEAQRPFRLDLYDREAVKEKGNYTNKASVAPSLDPKGEFWTKGSYWKTEVKNSILDSPRKDVSEEAVEEAVNELFIQFSNCLPPMLDVQGEDGEPEKKIPEDVEKRALDLLEDPGFLDKIRRTLTRGFTDGDTYRFIEGESKKKLFTYLCFLSAKTPFPQFEWISGDPGSGKTNMASTVSRLFPEGYVQEVGYITGAGIRYLEGKDYEVLYVQEFRGQEEQDVRLTSVEDRGFKVIIAGRNQDTGEMSAEEHFVPAKAFVTTSADELPTDQLVRRTWLVSADESDELTRRVNERLAEDAEGKAEPVDEDWIEVLRAVPSLIEEKEVLVPYASEILEVTDWDRTNYKQFLRIVKIIAHAHQRQREEKDGKIVSDIRDLYMAFRICDEVLPETLFKLPKRLEEALKAVKKKSERMGEVTKKDVASELEKAGSTVYSYLEDLYNMGFVHKDKSGRENVYTPSEKSKGELSFRWIENLDWSKCEKKVEKTLDGNLSTLCKVSNPKEGFIIDDPILKGRLLVSPSPGGRLRAEKIVSGDNDGSDLELDGKEVLLTEDKSLESIISEDGKSDGGVESSERAEASEEEGESVPEIEDLEASQNEPSQEEVMRVLRNRYRDLDEGLSKSEFVNEVKYDERLGGMDREALMEHVRRLEEEDGVWFRVEELG